MKEFKYFSNQHLFMILMVLAIILCFYHINKNISEEKFAIYRISLGIIALFIKLSDSLIRIFIEKHDYIVILPLNVCNISLICGSIYLITNNNKFFNYACLLSLGATLAMIFPDWTTYRSELYPFSYFISHIMIYVLILTGYQRMNAKVVYKNFVKTLKLMTNVLIIAYFINLYYQVNFLFINDYVLPQLEFIKPFELYVIMIICAHFIIIKISYDLYKRINK